MRRNKREALGFQLSGRGQMNAYKIRSNIVIENIEIKDPGWAGRRARERLHGLYIGAIGYPAARTVLTSVRWIDSVR